MRILFFLLISVASFGQIPLWQLEYAPDSMKVIGAAADGEPIWVPKGGGISSVFIDSDSLYYVVEGDTINAGFISSGGGGQDSTVINSGYGIDVTESPTNTYTIKADTSELVTPHDLSLVDQSNTNEIQTISYNPGTRTVSMSGGGGGWIDPIDLQSITKNNTTKVVTLSQGGGTFTDERGVTTVAISNGTGIQVTGSPITSTGTINVTNTKPFDLLSFSVNSEPFPLFVTNLSTVNWTGSGLTSVSKSGNTLTINSDSDTTLISQLISDSLATIVFPTYQDSTIVSAGTGISVTESPANTFTIEVDSSEVATQYDLTLKENKLTGTTGQTLRFGSTNSVSASSLLYNDGNTISINNTSPVVGPKFQCDGISLFSHNSYTPAMVQFINSSAAGAGIYFQDNTANNDNFYWDGLFKTFSLGGAFASITNKKLHVHGGVTVGSGYDATAIDANSLKVQGSVTVGTTSGTPSTNAALDVNGKIVSSTLTSGTVTSVGLTLGTSGTDANVSGSPITSSGSFTLNLPTASASNRGLLSAANWSTFNNKVGGSGANGYIPLWNGTSTQTNSIMIQNGNGIGVGGSPTYYFDVLASAYGSYGARIYNQGIGNRNGLLIKSDESNVGRYPFKIESTGAPNAFTVNADGTVGIGVATTTNSVLHLYAGAASARLESSISNARCEFNFVNSSKNYSFGINPDGGSANFFALYDNAAGKYPFYVDPTNNTVVINRVFGSYASKALNVNGGVQVQDLVGSGNRLVYADGTGILNHAVIGTGLSLSSGTLSATAVLSGTLNAIPYFNTTSSLASMPITYSTGLPAMVFPTGNAIWMQGTSSIIDKTNSYGATNQILTKASGGGVIWADATVTGTNLSYSTKSGTDVYLESSSGADVIIRDGVNNTVNRVASNVIKIDSDVTYGQLWEEGGETTAITTTPTKIDFTSSTNNNVTMSTASDNITIVDAGTYEIDYSVSFTSVAAAFATEINVYKNSSSASTGRCKTLAGGTSTTSPMGYTQSKSGIIIGLAASDVLDLRVWCSGGASTSVYLANQLFSVKRIK